MKRPLVIDGTIITVPIHDDAQTAMSEFFADHMIELAAWLAPYSLDPRTIVVPKFERLVDPAEVQL